MSVKQRWDDPANEGQIDYEKVGARFAALIMLLVLAAIIKIGLRDNWLGTFRDITGY